MPLKSNFVEWDQKPKKDSLNKGIIAEIAKVGSFVAIEGTPMYAST